MECKGLISASSLWDRLLLSVRPLLSELRHFPVRAKTVWQIVFSHSSRILRPSAVSPWHSLQTAVIVSGATDLNAEADMETVSCRTVLNGITKLLVFRPVGAFFALMGCLEVYINLRAVLAGECREFWLISGIWFERNINSILRAPATFSMPKVLPSIYSHHYDTQHFFLTTIAILTMFKRPDFTMVQFTILFSGVAIIFLLPPLFTKSTNLRSHFVFSESHLGRSSANDSVNNSAVV